MKEKILGLERSLRMPTLKDIAKAAGVSHSTVSNVLNKKSCVSSEKIRLVEEAARSLGYRIDEQASLLRKGVTRTVAVILPNIECARFADLYIGIIKVLDEHGFTAKLFLTEDMPYREYDAVDSAVAAKACAILTVSCIQDAARCYRMPSLRHTPILFLDREPVAGAVTFTFDYEQAGRSMAQRMMRSGTGRVCVGIGNRAFSCDRDFEKGLLSVLPSRESPAVTQLLYGENAAEVYQPFLTSDAPQAVAASSVDIAEQFYNAFHAVGSGPQPVFYTLAPLRTAPDSRFVALALNYRKLGFAAATAAARHIDLGEALTGRVFPADGFRALSPAAAPLAHKTLRVVALASPSASALASLAPSFTRSTGIDVEIDTYPLSTIYKNILREDFPWDVIRLDVAMLKYLAPRVLCPLDSLDPGVAEQFVRFLPGLGKDFAEADGRIYALPFDISVQMLYYRLDLFESLAERRSFFESTHTELCVPQTFAQYNLIARHFTAAQRKASPTAFGTSIALGNPTSAASEFLVRLLALGGPTYGSNHLLRLDTPEALLALQNYREAALYASSVPVQSWSDVVDGFIRGDTAMTILFANHASRIVRTQEALSRGQVGCAPVPGSRPLLGGGSLGISNRSQQREEAYRFIQWATGDEIASRLMAMDGISPCRSAYEQRKLLDAYPWLCDFGRNLELGCRSSILSNDGSVFNLRSFDAALGRLITDAIRGEKSEEETLWRAQQFMDDLAVQKEEGASHERGERDF